MFTVFEKIKKLVVSLAVSVFEAFRPVFGEMVAVMAAVAVLVLVSIPAVAANIIPLKPDSANPAVMTVIGSASNAVVIGKTAAPSAGVELEVQAQTTGDGAAVKISSASGSSMLEVENDGHVATLGSAPSLSSCGTTPTIVGTDFAMKITVGGSGASACAVTFATAYTNAPICTVSDETNATTIKPVATASAVTLTATIAASDVLDVICIGRK